MGIRIDTKTFLFYGIFILTLIWVLQIIGNYKKFKIYSKRRILVYVFCVYIIALIGITLFPLDIKFGDFIYISPRFNLIPIKNTIIDIRRDFSNNRMQAYYIEFWIKNIVGNIILFIPFGALLPKILKIIGNFKRVLLTSFLFSLSIEVLQVLSIYIGTTIRSFDVDDIILNTIGGCLGYIIYQKFLKNYFHSDGKFNSTDSEILR